MRFLRNITQKLLRGLAGGLAFAILSLFCFAAFQSTAFALDLPGIQASLDGFHLSPSLALVLGGVLDFGLRLLPSEKPKSVLLLIGSILDVAKSAIVDLDEAWNMIVPQRVKPAAPQALAAAAPAAPSAPAGGAKA